MLPHRYWVHGLRPHIIFCDFIDIYYFTSKSHHPAYVLIFIAHLQNFVFAIRNFYICFYVLYMLYIPFVIDYLLIFSWFFWKILLKNSFEKSFYKCHWRLAVHFRRFVFVIRDHYIRFYVHLTLYNIFYMSLHWFFRYFWVFEKSFKNSFVWIFWQLGHLVSVARSNFWNPPKIFQKSVQKESKDNCSLILIDETYQSRSRTKCLRLYIRFKHYNICYWQCLVTAYCFEPLIIVNFFYQFHH